MSKRIAFLGPEATFTDLAVSQLFPDHEKVPMATIPDCLAAVEADEIGLALVPIENALEGSVNMTIDYLYHEAGLPIRGEITTPIQQHYLIHPDNDKPGFKPEFIYSHSHAIAQCRKFLHGEMKGIPSESTTSTAAAAKMVRDHPERPIAAIANEMAAKVYGLKMAARDIHDYPHNHTKFIVVSKGEVDFAAHQAVEQGAKTTLMVTLPVDQSGALHQVLSAFAWRRLNLVKIESRPLKTGLGDYFFIIDIDREMDDVLIPGAIAEMEALGCRVSLLGSYPSFRSRQERTAHTS